ncbi:MAG TPA: sulfatase [Phycisphaerae bacterium]|nr:sulfatase [Phycisphaerae bacterium]
MNQPLSDNAGTAQTASRRDFLRSSAALAVTSMLPGAARAAAPSKRPNILLLIGDDWSWPHAGVLGDPVVKTPTFDRVAREGVLFRRAFTPAPSCTPSRAAMATGQHHWRLEGVANLGGSLPQRIPTYQDLLREAGYHVGFSGKGIAPGGNIHRSTEPCGRRFRSFEEFMKARPAGAPLAYWFGSGDPHRPYGLGEGVAGGMDPRKVRVPACLPDTAAVRSDLCDYHARVQRFDARCGQILGILEKSGELDNTLVVMTSDNGMPFPRCKATLYDDGTRMPLAVRWPAGAKGGRTVDDFVSLCDLAPTFLAVAGVNVPKEVSGVSLLGILRSDKSGRIEKDRTFVLLGMERHCYPYPARAIRTGEFLYVRNHEPDRWPTGEGTWPSEDRDFSFNIDPSPTKRLMVARRTDAAIKGLYDLAFGPRPEEELYDLAKDAGQVRNVASKPEYAETKRKLAGMLEQALKDSDDPRVKGLGDRFNRYRSR